MRVRVNEEGSSIEKSVQTRIEERSTRQQSDMHEDKREIVHMKADSNVFETKCYKEKRGKVKVNRQVSV